MTRAYLCLALQLVHPVTNWQKTEKITTYSLKFLVTWLKAMSDNSFSIA